MTMDPSAPYVPLAAAPPPINPAAVAHELTQEERRQQIDLLCKRHELRPQIAQDLIRVISPVRVVMIVDDSSSMVQEEIPEGTTNPFAVRAVKITRWSEAVQNTAMVCEYVFAICHEPVDVYFLNRPKVMGAKSNADLAAAFAAPPDGNTPLTAAFNHVMADYAWTRDRNQPLLVIIFTDGEPTTPDGLHSDLDGFKRSLLSKPKNVHTCIVECTDDEASMDYIDQWKGQIPQFDGIDHFVTEVARVRNAQGPAFAFGRADYIALILLGTFMRNYFLVDQAKLNLGAGPQNMAAVSALGNAAGGSYGGAVGANAAAAGGYGAGGWAPQYVAPAPLPQQQAGYIPPPQQTYGYPPQQQQPQQRQITQQQQVVVMNNNNGSNGCCVVS